jgi:hypothetical protein
METALRPYAIYRDEGERLSFLGALTWIKATGEQTGAAPSACLSRCSHQVVAAPGICTTTRTSPSM